MYHNEQFVSIGYFQSGRWMWLMELVSIVCVWPAPLLFAHRTLHTGIGYCPLCTVLAHWIMHDAHRTLHHTVTAHWRHTWYLSWAHGPGPLRKICHVEKFQISVKILNNLWSFIKICAVFVLSVWGEKSVWRKSVWRKNDKYEVCPWRVWVW